MKPRYLKKKYKVGISGHRDLKKPEIVNYKKQITNFLEYLKEKHTEKEIFIISPLADGADRLIVQCAIALGIRYEVILPMPEGLYLDDFSEASRKEFTTLNLNAAASQTLPLCQGNTIDSIKSYGSQRDKQYLVAGQEVVDRSDFMLFLWDGVDNGLTGGTADIIKYTKLKDKSLFIIECERETKKGEMIDD